MAEYLAAEADLIAVADAIRAKTGSITPLYFPAGFVSAVNGISALRYAVIDLEVTAADSTEKVFVHNLNSVHVAALLFPTDPVRATGYYQTYYAEILNLPDLLPTQTSLDFTSYNSGKFPAPITVNLRTHEKVKIANGLASPYTTQSNWYMGTFYGQERVSYWTVNPNDIRYSRAIAPGKYRMVVADLSPLAAALNGA